MKCFIFFALIAFASATTVVFYPIADAYLDSGHRDTNFGHVSDGYVFRDNYQTGDFYELVTKFNLSNLIGLPITPVVSAVVSYQQESVSQEEIPEITGPTLLFDAYTTYTNWTESAVTWNNPPISISRFLADYQDGDVNTVTFPVTAQINNALTAGTSLVAFRIHSAYSVVNIYMRESPIQVRPKLTITY
jgi:hypothetical protein